MYKQIYKNATNEDITISTTYKFNTNKALILYENVKIGGKSSYKIYICNQLRKRYN